MTREEALNAITAFVENYACGSDLDGLREAIEALKEPKQGEWISKPKRVQVDETDEERIFETILEWFCSSCGKSFDFRKPNDAFCPNCGARMRGDEK